MRKELLLFLVLLFGPTIIGLAVGLYQIAVFKVAPFDPQLAPVYVSAVEAGFIVLASLGLAYFAFLAFGPRKLAGFFAIALFIFSVWRAFAVSSAWFMKLGACCCCESLPSWGWLVNATINPSFPFLWYSWLY